MVMEIVSESFQEVDSLENVLGVQVLVEKNHRNEAVAFHILQTRVVLQLHGGFSVSEFDGRNSAHALTSIGEFLQEDLGENSISIFGESNGEDNSATVILGLQVDRFIATVVNSHNLAVALLGNNVSEDLFERSGEEMTLQVTDFQGKVFCGKEINIKSSQYEEEGCLLGSSGGLFTSTIKETS